MLRNLLAFALAATAIPAAAQTKPPQFSGCAVCHSVTPDKKPGVGPGLHGVVGRKAGSLPNYKYSPAMAKYGKTWDRATLIAYLTNPKGTVPGNKMVWPAQKPEVAAAIADYLAGLK